MSARAAPAYGSNKCICPVLGCQAAFPQLPILRYHCTVIHDSDRVLLPCFSFRNVTQCPVCFQIRATQGSTHNCLGSSEARLASARDKQIQQTDHLAFLVWSNSNVVPATPVPFSSLPKPHVSSPNVFVPLDPDASFPVLPPLPPMHPILPPALPVENNSPVDE